MVSSAAGKAVETRGDATEVVMSMGAEEAAAAAGRGAAAADVTMGAGMDIRVEGRVGGGERR